MIISARFVARPNLRFLFGHPYHFIALGFGVGLAPVAPGTFGTLLALPIFWLLSLRLDAAGMLIVLGFLYVGGVWVCDRTGRDLGVEDHKAIVWDEVVAFLVVLFFTPAAPMWQALAFLLFRLFDILKPGPIRYVELRFRGGFGVMVDDLVAAFATLVCLALFKLLAPAVGDWLGFRTV
ncbi:MAG TPA: phosphatidylglycerophosphatase A [Burkholderiales bacterium]|nr:phosphatidylglycerophosphatase A [Burkholderiales bacterium]